MAAHCARTAMLERVKDKHEYPGHDLILGNVGDSRDILGTQDDLVKLVKLRTNGIGDNIMVYDMGYKRTRVGVNYVRTRSKAISLDDVDLFVAAIHGVWRWWSVGTTISPLVIIGDSLAHIVGVLGVFLYYELSELYFLDLFLEKVRNIKR
ncbi:hypothetical protein Tco_0756953 [Tanacetum coccineum]